MRITTSLGVFLLVVGVILIVASSGAFDSTLADRGVGVDNADDEADALLGLEASYDGTEIVYEEFFWGGTNEQSAVVLTVTNNVNGDWTDISVEVDSVIWGDGTTGNVLAVADAPETLLPDETGTVELECSQDTGGETTDATVELDISVDGENAPVAVERYSFPVTGIEFDCEGDDAGTGPPGDPVPIESVDELSVAGTPTAVEGEPFFGAAPDSRVTFDIEYTGDESVTMTGIQLRNTSSNATRVESILGDNSEIEIDAAEDGRLTADEGLSIGEISYPLDQHAVIDSEAGIMIQEFREGGELTRVDMTGEDVTVVLTVEGLDHDDSTAPVPVEIELENLE